MDESWRKPMGTSNGGTHRRRRSVIGTVSTSDASLEPEDFDDVYGGPPRSVLARKLSAEFGASEWFYQEVFRQPEKKIPAEIDGRMLPEFVIPEKRRSKQKAKSSMAKSKSTSSSVLSFEELSPFRPTGMIVGEEDVALASYTSRLRPINVTYRWSSTSTSAMNICKNKQPDLPAFGCNNIRSSMDNNIDLTRNEYMIKNYIFGSPHQQVPSPESIRINLASARTQAMAEYDMRPYPPSSAVSSFHHDPESKNITDFANQKSHIIYPHSIFEEGQVVEDEVMSSSYIIDLNDNSQTTEASNSEAIDIDEAIA